MKERVKELCSRDGISMNFLEKKLGFGSGYISKLKTANPNMKKIQAIADYFNVSVDYILTGKERSVTPADLYAGAEHVQKKLGLNGLDLQIFADGRGSEDADIIMDRRTMSIASKFFKLNEEDKNVIEHMINALYEKEQRINSPAQ